MIDEHRNRNNLLSGTMDWSGEWVRSFAWHADGTHDGFTVMTRTGEWCGLCKPVMLTAGHTYTFSACVKVEPGQGHIVQIYTAVTQPGDNDLATNEFVNSNSKSFYDAADGSWRVISHTFTPTASKRAYARVEVPGNYTLSICAYMLVEGDTPAAWAPAEGEMLAADVGGVAA